MPEQAERVPIEYRIHETPVNVAGGATKVAVQITTQYEKGSGKYDAEAIPVFLYEREHLPWLEELVRRANQGLDFERGQ